MNNTFWNILPWGGGGGKPDVVLQLQLSVEFRKEHCGEKTLNTFFHTWLGPRRFLQAIIQISWSSSFSWSQFSWFRSRKSPRTDGYLTLSTGAGFVNN